MLGDPVAFDVGLCVVGACVLLLLLLLLLALPLLLEDGARVAFDEVLPLLSLELLGDPVAFDPEPVALGGAVANEHDQSGSAPAALDRKAVPACAKHLYGARAPACPASVRQHCALVTLAHHRAQAARLRAVLLCSAMRVGCDASFEPTHSPSSHLEQASVAREVGAAPNSKTTATSGATRHPPPRMPRVAMWI